MALGQYKMRMIPLAYSEADAAPQKLPASFSVEAWAGLRIRTLLCDDQMYNGLTKNSIDIYMMNVYRWNQDGEKDGTRYDVLFEALSGLPIPLLWGEFDRVTDNNPKRLFDEVPYMFKDWTDRMSGGFAYSYGKVLQSGPKLFYIIESKNLFL